MQVKNIALHHSGGLGNNQYASTQHLTFKDIENYHRYRWNFRSTLGEYAGYGVGYDPKTRKWKQWRAIGEEMAAQRGHNFDTFPVLIIGNYQRQPFSNPGKPVDPVTKTMEADVASFLYDLVNGNKRGLAVKPGTTLNFSTTRVYPHRFFNPGTDCYGTFLSDNWARDLLVKYKEVSVEDDTVVLKERIKSLQLLIKLYMQLLDLMNRSKPTLSASERECEGFIQLT